MNLINSSSLFKQRFQWPFWLVGFALVAGFILSILSWLELCVEHCAANQDYRLFGFPFALFGITFFTLLMILHIFSRYYPFLSSIVGWSIASALGAETMFLLVQKYQIGHWCPVCLSIAASVAFASLVLTFDWLKNIKNSIQSHNRGSMMQQIKKGIASLSFVIAGFLMAFAGVSNPNSAEAAINDLKDKLVFGNKNSPVEVYFVSDWFCPSCKKIEPSIEQLYPKIHTKVAFYFIDYPIHKKSQNFTPYNIAFLVNNKNEYFKARQVLHEMTEKTESPKEEEIKNAAKKAGIPLKELSFLDVKTGMDYFDKIVDQYKLSATPTIIITNIHNHKVVKFEGRDEISEEKVLKAIDTLSK
jgi:protein-disulfide isomerase